MNRKKVLLLADPSSAHTIKWANALIDYHDIIIYGFAEDVNLRLYNKNVEVIVKQISNKIKMRSDGSLAKIFYLSLLPNLLKTIKLKKIDILHAHYASSYGLLGYLTFFKPFFISVWGSDVVEFPNKNFLFKNFIKIILKRANEICATSNDLANITQHFTKKNINVIPFGIDTEKFSFVDVTKRENVIGIVKSLEPNYGIEYLIKAFAELKKEIKEFNYKLLIVGSGSQFEYLLNLIKKLNIKEFTELVGYVDYDQIHLYHQKIKIGVYPSFKESFGVSIAEFMATGGVVLATNTGGIKEIIDNMENGILIEKPDVELIKNAIIYYLNKPKEMELFSNAARKKILDKYSLINSIKKMLDLYSKY